MKIAAWRVREGEKPSRLQASVIELERHLHDWIEEDPALVLPGLELVGREVRVEGGRLDLIGIDPVGRWFVIEIKAGFLYRDVVAQVLDYVASVQEMDETALRPIADAYLTSRKVTNRAELLARAFPERIDGPEARDVSAIVVGTGVDPGLERLSRYLADRHDIPLRTVTFEVVEVSPDDRILVREAVDTPSATEVVPESNLLEPVLDAAARSGNRARLEAILSAAQSLGLYPRPWKRCIMFAPPGHRNRALFTVWADGTYWTSAESLAEFYPVSEDEVTAALGADGYRRLDDAGVRQLTEGLTALLAGKSERSDPPTIELAPSVDTVLERAQTDEIRQKMQMLLGAARELNLPVRAWKSSLMIAPLQNRTRALITMWTDGNIGVWAPAFEQFYGIEAAKVEQSYGTKQSLMSVERVAALAAWFEESLSTKASASQTDTKEEQGNDD